MKPNALAPALCFASAVAFVLADGAQARRLSGGSQPWRWKTIASRRSRCTLLALFSQHW